MVCARLSARRLRDSAQERHKALGFGVGGIISIVEIKEIMRSTGYRCPYLKPKYKFDRIGEKKQHPHSPSRDQIVPGMGYFKWNVQAVSWDYNNMRGKKTQEQINEMAKAILNPMRPSSAEHLHDNQAFERINDENFRAKSRALQMPLGPLCSIL